MAEALFETLSRCAAGQRRDPHPNFRLDALGSIVETTVSTVFNVNVASLRAGSRGEAQVAQARQVAMYLAHCTFGLTHTDVGRMFERDRTTVAHACAIVEDRRDDPVFDRTVSNLEEICFRLAAVSGLAREI